MKSGEDLAKLDKQFKRLCSHYASTMPDNFTSPIEVLRSMIPTADVSPPRPLVCDPSLSLQNEDPDLWREYTAEAKRVMPQFNGSLREAIQLDRESDTCRSFRSSSSPPLVSISYSLRSGCGSVSS